MFLENVFEPPCKAFLIVTIPLGMEPFLFGKISFSPGKAPGLRIIQAICLPEAVRERALWRD